MRIVSIPPSIRSAIEREFVLTNVEAQDVFLGQMADLSETALALFEKGRHRDEVVADLVESGWPSEVAEWLAETVQGQGAPLAFTFASSEPAPTNGLVGRPKPPPVAGVAPPIAAAAPPVAAVKPVMPSVHMVSRTPRSPMLFDVQSSVGPKSVELDPSKPLDQQSVSPLATHFPEWDLVLGENLVRRGVARF